MLYYIAAVLYVLVCFRDDRRHSSPAGEGGRPRERLWRRRRPGSLRRAERRDGPDARDHRAARCCFWWVRWRLNILAQRGPGSVVGGRAPQGAPTTTLPTPAQGQLRRRLRLPRHSSRPPAHRRRRRRRLRVRHRGPSLSSRGCKSSFHPRPYSDGPHPRGSGGIGRRTSLRGWRPQGREGSSPFFRTITSSP